MVLESGGPLHTEFHKKSTSLVVIGEALHSFCSDLTGNKTNNNTLPSPLHDKLLQVCVQGCF
jgi:hypothetical protein